MYYRWQNDLDSIHSDFPLALVDDFSRENLVIIAYPARDHFWEHCRSDVSHFLTLSFRSSVRDGVDWSSRSFKSYRIFYDFMCVWWINIGASRLLYIGYYFIWIDIIHRVRVSQISGWICTSATKLINCSVNEQPWFCYLSLHCIFCDMLDSIDLGSNLSLVKDKFASIKRENVKSWQWWVNNLII